MPGHETEAHQHGACMKTEEPEAEEFWKYDVQKKQGSNILPLTVII